MKRFNRLLSLLLAAALLLSLPAAASTRKADKADILRVAASIPTDGIVPEKKSMDISFDYIFYPSMDTLDAADASTFARTALAWATQEKLINGISGSGATRLVPKNTATRAQIATIIMRYLDDTTEDA